MVFISVQLRSLFYVTATFNTGTNIAIICCVMRLKIISADGSLNTH